MHDGAALAYLFRGDSVQADRRVMCQEIVVGHPPKRVFNDRRGVHASSHRSRD